MKQHRIILSLIALLLVGSFVQVYAEPEPYTDYSLTRKPRTDVAWNKKTRSYKGLYTRRTIVPDYYFSIRGAATWYVGDFGGKSNAFQNYIEMNQFIRENDLSASEANAARSANWSGAGGFMCNLILSSHFQLRTQIMVGNLRGNNKFFNEQFDAHDAMGDTTSAFWTCPGREFSSIYLEPQIGVEYYPVKKVGFFLYAGVAVTMGWATKYRFTFPDYRDEWNETRQEINNLAEANPPFIINPHIPFGFGYKQKIGKDWLLGIEYILHVSLLNVNKVSFDGWPYEWETGAAVGYRVDKNQRDVYSEFAVTLSYMYHTCPTCRAAEW